MIDLLAALFDRNPDPVLIVSSYDGTITYANGPAVKHQPGSRQDRPEDFTGAHLSELFSRWGVTEEQTAIARCLADPNHGLDYQDNFVDDIEGWWIASAVPCSDMVAPELVTTRRNLGELPRAIAEHHVLAERIAIALEYARVRRLQEAALSALTDANSRLDWVGRLLIEAGNRPINPLPDDVHGIKPPGSGGRVEDEQPQALRQL